MEANVIQINGGTTINDDVSVKMSCMWKRIWNPATCSCKNWKYLASIIDYSVTRCNELIDKEYKTKKQKHFQQILIKNATCKIKSSIFYLPFY